MPTTSSSKGSAPAPCDAHDTLVRVVTSIETIAAADWDRCANPQGLPFNPFVSHAFLSALEKSGSAVPKTGWGAQHLIAEDKNGTLLGVMPLYLKGHSYGEYIFDHSWADAYERAGGRYYPKLLSAVPFTPATGRRFLAMDQTRAEAIEGLLTAGLVALAERHHVSSAHVNFLTRGEWERLELRGFLRREDQQFHWFNEGFSTYDDFLATLASRKRKQLKKERAEALSDGISIRWLTGSQITERDWDTFFEFYMDTGSRKWGTPYLKRTFFSLVGETMRDNILLVMCARDGRDIAGALNFIGGDTLYGRYWGAIEEHPSLHFEACYHQAIDFAIACKLRCVEAGAQGEHKLARGYRPVPVYSAHWIADESFRDAVARYLVSERRHIENAIDVLSDHTPYRKDLEFKYDRS